MRLEALHTLLEAATTPESFFETAIWGGGRIRAPLTACLGGRGCPELGRGARALPPLALVAEAAHLAGPGVPDALERLLLDRRCVVVTPFHSYLNRLQELTRGKQPHGSCGLGVGQAILDAERGGLPVLRAGEPHDRSGLLRRLRFLSTVKIDQAEQLVGRAPSDGLQREMLERLRPPGLVEALAETYQRLVRAAPVRWADEETLESLLEAPRPVLFEGGAGGPARPGRRRISLRDSQPDRCCRGARAHPKGGSARPGRSESSRAWVC